MSNPKLISFIARSKRRMEILKLLSQSTLSPPEIMKKTGMYKSHTSRTIKELVNQELIKSINSEDRYYRFYKITKKGKETLNKIEKILN